MFRVRHVVFLLSVVLLATSSPLTNPSLGAREPTKRQVYVTVADAKGQAVPGLTSADLVLKEGGRDREIVSVEPATEKMHVAIAIEESLTPHGGVRQAVADFVQKMTPQAEIALVVLGISNRMAVPYTSDRNTLMAGLNALPLIQRTQVNHIPEGIAELARAFLKVPRARPVIVAIAMDLQQASSEEPQNVLNLLKDSGAQLHVVSIEAGSMSGSPSQLMEMSGRAQVLGDGPKQSGGKQWPVNALTAVSLRGMQQVANDLSNQYRITYVLPDGVKPSDRLSVELKRKGATLRAPTRISNK